jgi:hypothetical protein
VLSWHCQGQAEDTTKGLLASPPPPNSAYSPNNNNAEATTTSTLIVLRNSTSCASYHRNEISKSSKCVVSSTFAGLSWSMSHEGGGEGREITTNLRLSCLRTFLLTSPAYSGQFLQKKTPWSESASELYRPSDSRLSAKLVSTFADRGYHVVSVTDPYGRTLGFLDRSRYFSIK